MANTQSEVLREVGARIHGASGNEAPFLAEREAAYVIEPGAPPGDLHHWEPGPAQVLNLVCAQIANVRLDLTGLVVVADTAREREEMATSVAVLAGAARVIALSRTSKRRLRTSEPSIAGLANLAGRIEVASRIDPRVWQDVDIFLSCPDLAPISRSVVELFPSTAVVGLMAEPWEVRPGAVNFEACREMGIKVVAPNLSHPSIDLLPHMAQLCCQLIGDAGIETLNAKIAVLSDTPCGPFIERALLDRGADTHMYPHPLLLARADWDAVVVAMRPSDRPSMDINGLAAITHSAGGAKLIQFSGEIDRIAARYFGFRVWPVTRPRRGQLGIAADAFGRAATVRRLVGGLKAAEAARRGSKLGADDVGFVVDGLT